MKKKPRIFWLVIIVCLAFFSIPMATIVEDGLIQPTVKFFWVLKGYYGSISQLTFWVLMLIGVVVIAVLSLRTGALNIHFKKRRVGTLPGEVGQLAYWIKRFDRGLYARWYVTRTLADLTLQLLKARGSNAGPVGELQGSGWEPPRQIQDYLETALQTNPATFKQRLEESGITTEPDLESIIDYLESYTGEDK